MAYVIGIVLFAFGILASVCLHEAGHMGTAKAFGMKVTRYFVGFGPTLWSFRRGETEYGVKALPAGGFVKIVGMTPLEDDVEPVDEPRAFWRKPLWQRTIVLSAGSVTHFIIGFILLWIAAAFVGVPNNLSGTSPSSRAEIGVVANCVDVKYDPKATADHCAAGSPQSPAAVAGLRKGDVITAVNGQRVRNWNELVGKIRPAGDGTVTLSYTRDGKTRTTRATLVRTERPKSDAKVDAKTGDVALGDLEQVGTLGVSPSTIITVGPIAGVQVAGDLTGQLFVGTFQAIGKFPEKIPKLIDALSGQQRDPETPVSVVGATRIGGEAVQQGIWPLFVLLLAQLNLFIGVFNLFPLLPLDGGHIAIAWYEKIRSWFARKFGRADPGRVDYTKLMPITYAVVLIFGSITLLTVATDIVNPITLNAR